MSRAIGIGACRQRVVDLILRTIRQPEKVGEVAVQLLGARGNCPRRRGFAIVVIVAVRVIHEHEELVPPIEDFRDQNRSAVRCREINPRVRCRERNIREPTHGERPQSVCQSKPQEPEGDQQENRTRPFHGGAV